jgi:2-oxoglutarate ferredoxin oxidoreductase subunit alpha
MFARACAMGGLHVYGQREYYSNIMGEHSYFQVRVADYPVLATSDRIHLLVSFDAETVFLHSQNVVPQGGIIYDPKLESTSLERVPTMDERVRHDLAVYLQENRAGDTLGDFLKLQAKRGVHLYPVPYDEMLQKLASELNESLSALKRMTNTIAVAASCALLKYGVEWLDKALNDVFKGKKKVVDLNIRVCEMTYEYMTGGFEDKFLWSLEPRPTQEKRIYVNGNQAVAMGKILAGCTFQTYYPISPATDESTYLESHEVFKLNDRAKSEMGSLLVVQTEDEISAINMATGAALAGARAATATSGPGFSLMVEGLGFASINEVPVVITLYQRGSPSTGLPTRTEQGDLWFAVYAGHGEGPRIVLASGDAEEGFYDAIRSFNWAEQYQVPVIHLMDKSIASSSQTCPVFDVSGVELNRGKLLTEEELLSISQNGSYKGFEFSEDGVSRRSVYGQKGGVFWKTSDEHDESGHITEDPVIRVKMMDKRMKKLDTIASEIPADEKLAVYGDPKSENVIVSWGSPKGAILEVIEMLKAEDISVKFVQIKLIWPLPVQEIIKNLKSAKIKIGIENNFSGQLAKLIRQETDIAIDQLIVKYNGRQMSIDELYETLKKILSGKKVEKKVVLTHGT